MSIIKITWFWLLSLMLVQPYIIYSQNTPYSNYETLDCKEFKIIDTNNLKADTIGFVSSPCTVYFGACNFSKVVFDSLVDFSKSIFNPHTRFNASSFLKRATFQYTRFLSGADFSHSKFHKEADFRKATFYRPTSFALAEFDTTANFFSARFDSLADFSEAKFNAQVNFFGTHFYSPVIFDHAMIRGKHYFIKTILNADVSFKETSFDSPAYFRECDFQKALDFTGARFSELADFSFSKFSGFVLFKDAILPDTLRLSNVKDLQYAIDLTTCNFTESNYPVYLDIGLSDIEMLKLDYRYFKIHFPDEGGYAHSDKVTAFEELLKVQNKYGYTTGYEKLDKEYQEYVYLTNNKYAANWFQKHWLNYGYNPAWLIIRNLVFIGLALITVRFILNMRTKRIKQQY